MKIDKNIKNVKKIIEKTSDEQIQRYREARGYMIF